MRIIGGFAKGRNIRVGKAFLQHSPHSSSLRPSSAKVRKALFDIIGKKIEGCVFADVFAGSAAVGIEAASRGASNVVCVEKDKQRADIIKAMAFKIGLQQSITVFCMDAERFFTSNKTAFDIIFFDPPYFTVDLSNLLNRLCHRSLADDALVFCEHHKKTALCVQYQCLKLQRQYVYGDTVLSKFVVDRHSDTIAYHCD